MLLLGTSQKIRLSRRCTEVPSSRFLYASGFVTQILAHMLDSLVRVSRRVEECYLVSNTDFHKRLWGHSQPHGIATMTPKVCLGGPARSPAWQETPVTKHEQSTSTLTLRLSPLSRANSNLAKFHLALFTSTSAISHTFNSLFKVLFIFPSWYLFAIGLKRIFSFG